MNELTHPPTPAPLLSSPPTLTARFLEPEGLQWGRFPVADGATLRWAHLPVPHAKLDCVLVGGFSECIEKYFECMRDLAARGIAVWMLDWRGQGGSERDPHFLARPQARNFDRDAAELTAFVQTVMPPARPRLLVAHSMGGAIATLALHANPKLVDLAVLSAPMYGLVTGPFPEFAARALARSATAAGFGKNFIPGAGPWKFNRLLTALTSPVSHDPERCLVQRSWFESSPRLRIDGLTYGWLDAAFAFSDRLMARGFLEAVTTPILLGSASREFFVNPTRHHQAAARLPNGKLVSFSGARHELFMEADKYRRAWFAEIDAFIAAHFT